MAFCANSRFRIPEWVHPHSFSYDPQNPPLERVEQIKMGLEKFRVSDPIATIILPVYNEENDILGTLSSLAAQVLNYPTEIIVVNNNSTDNTQHLLDLCQVNNIFVKAQGVTHARNNALNIAKGMYILSVDSDTFYPPFWADAFIEALQKNGVSCAYAKYSFLPLDNSNVKISLGIFEYFSQLKYISRKLKGRPYLNVYGFNSGFVKEAALAVGGYDLSSKVWEDGRLANTLMKVGKLKLVTDPRAFVYTSSRRIQLDGGLWAGFGQRLRKEINRLFLFKKPK